MTRDDLIRLAQDAGFHPAIVVAWMDRELPAFVQLIIAEFLERTGQYVTNDASREAAITEAVAPWKNAVIEQLVVAHIFTAEHENDPRKAIQDLLAYHSDIAVDPRVSEAAARLVEQGRAEENEACEKACDAIAADRWDLYKGRSPYSGREEGRASAQVQGESNGAEMCSAAILERRTAAKPSDRMVQWVKDQAEKRERVAAEHVARGECPECDGSGEIGGQFSGGDLPCPSCAGAGRLSQNKGD